MSRRLEGTQARREPRVFQQTQALSLIDRFRSGGLSAKPHATAPEAVQLWVAREPRRTTVVLSCVYPISITPNWPCLTASLRRTRDAFTNTQSKSSSPGTVRNPG